MIRHRGFTLLELLVVVAIIGLLASLVLFAIDESRQKGRDSNRASQVQELMKAAELFYSERGVYPADGVVNDNVQLNTVSEFLNDNGGFIARFPEDPVFNASNGYFYCTNDPEGDEMTIFVHAESGSGEHCYVSRGSSAPQDYCGTDLNDPASTPIAGLDDCNDRF